MKILFWKECESCECLRFVDSGGKVIADCDSVGRVHRQKDKEQTPPT